MRRPIAVLLPLLALLALGAPPSAPRAGAADGDALIEEPISFEIDLPERPGSEERYRLEGRLTYRVDLPSNAGAPGVLLIHGSNDGRRLRKDADVSIPGERTSDGNPAKRFRALAETLARAGFVVLRHHKRGYAERPRDDRMDVVRTISLESSIDDATRALARLREAAPRVDPDRIVLLGYSEGSMIGPVIAQNDPKVVGLILMGCVVDFDHVARFQTSIKPVDDAFDAFDLNDDDRIDAAETVAPPPPGSTRPAWLLARGQLDRDGDGAISRAEALSYHDETAYVPFKRRSESPSDYWHGHFRARTNLEVLPKLDRPIVMLQGEEDWRTPVGEARKLEEAMKAASHPDFTLRYFPGLGHGFSPPKPPPPGGKVREETAGPLDPAVLETLADLARRKFGRTKTGTTEVW